MTALSQSNPIPQRPSNSATWVARLSVGARIGAGFAVIMLLLLAVSTVMGVKLLEIERRAVLVSNVIVPSGASLSKIMVEISGAAIDQRDHLLYRTRAPVDARAQRWRVIGQERGVLDSLLPQFASNATLSAWRVAKERMDIWQALQDDLEQAVLAGKLGADAEREMLRTRVAQARGPLRDAIDGAVNPATGMRQGGVHALLTTQVEAELASINRETKATLTAMALAVLVTLFISIIAAVTAARSVARPLHAITTTLQHLAGGDTALDVPGRNRGDEIGAWPEGSRFSRRP